MNKYLLMSAAAAIAATAGTNVATAATTVHFHSAGGATYCDYLVINNSGGGLYAAVHHGGVTCVSTSLQNDAGVKDKKGKVPGGGGSTQFADTTIARADGLWDGLDFDLGKFTTGAWALILNTNGTTAFVLNGGSQSAKVKPGAKLTKSTASDIIKALRAK
jgi:hypothetical protein